jgi:hypothetical protein
MDRINQNYYCAISKDVMLNPVKASCGHIFNHKSIEMWLYGTNKTCPLDRKPIDNWEPQENLQKEIHTFIHLNPSLFENKTVTQLEKEQKDEFVALLESAQSADFSTKVPIYSPGTADFIPAINPDHPLYEVASSFQIDPSPVIENLNNSNLRILEGITTVPGIRGPVKYTQLMGDPVDEFVKNLITTIPEIALLSMLGETHDEFATRNVDLNRQSFGFRIITHSEAFQIVRLPRNEFRSEKTKNLMILGALSLSVLIVALLSISYTSEGKI